MAYLNSVDFLNGITGGTEDFEIKGLGTIKLRALEYMDVERIQREADDDQMKAGLLMAVAGIAEPKLDAEQVLELQRARPGVIAKIARRVSEISGMSEEVENLAGSGS